MAKPLPLLIIGAGPYGLAMSAYAGRNNLEHVVVGKTMDFWKSNMPDDLQLNNPVSMLGNRTGSKIQRS